MSVWTEQDQYLVQLPLDQYIQTVIKDKVIHVQGPEWESLFKNVLAAETGATVDEAWAKHINKASYSNDFYFCPSDAPLSKTTAGLQPDFREGYLALDQGGQTTYLRLRYLDSEGLSSGMDEPPTGIFYPYRIFSPWLALIGLAAYIFLPRQKRGPNTIHYAGWRILLGDLVGFLLIFLFFSLPILIAGGSSQVITKGWLLPALFFWVFILLAAWWLGYNAWYAAYNLELLPDCL